MCYVKIKFVRMFGLVAFLFSAFSFSSRSFGMESKLDEYVKTYVDLKLFSGTVLVAKGGEILFCKAYGMANLEHDVPNKIDTKFGIASVTKQFTAMAIMQLQDMGLLDVQDKLSKYIFDYPRGNEITIHHLLTHTSGIPDVTSSSSEFQKKRIKPHAIEQLIARFKNIPLDFNPGEKYAYSNPGYNLLAYIIQKVSGKTYEAFLQEHIFDKLNMKDSGCDGHKRVIKNRASGYSVVGDDFVKADYIDMSTEIGDGDLYTTVKDLYLWDRALYTEKLVSQGTLNKIFTVDKNNYGYGWVIKSSQYGKVIGHNGQNPGIRADISRYVDNNVCIIVLSNYDNSPVEEISKNIGHIVFGQKPEYPKKYLAITVDPKIYDQYVGTYKAANEGLTFIVTKEGDKLFIELVEQQYKAEIYPKTENEFFCKSQDAQCSFVKDEGGKVTKMIAHLWNVDIIAQKIVE